MSRQRAELRQRRPWWCGVFGLCLLLAPACSESTSTVTHVDTHDMAASHIARLAAAEALGDAAGGPGEAAATQYVKDYLASIGLETFVQFVPLVRMTPTSTFVRVIKSDGTPVSIPADGVDYVIWSGRQKEQVSVEGQVVFVGYGIVSPEYDRDDYKDVDVKGKVVLVLEGSPHTNDQDDLGMLGEVYYGRRSYKFSEAWRRGATAVLIVHGDLEPWQDVVRQSSGPVIDIAAAEGAETKAAIQGWVEESAATRLFAATGLDYVKLRRQSRELAFRPVAIPSIRLALAMTSTIDRMVSRSITALQRGRTGEYVMASARWNRLPFASRRPSTEVLPAAAATPGPSPESDNGSGAAVLMESARRMVAQNPHPLRSVVFTISTALRPGILALQNYANHPQFPLDKTIAHVFLDRASPHASKWRIGKIGAAHPSLAQMTRAAAIGQGRLLVLNQDLDKRYYYSFTQSVFGRLGIPCLYLTTPAVDVPRGRARARLSDTGQNVESDSGVDWDARLLTTLLTSVVEATNWPPAVPPATAPKR